MKMIKLILVGCFCTVMNVHAEVGEHHSRYGKLQIKVNPETSQETLYFNQKLIRPRVEGNDSLSIYAAYKLGTSDVFLLQDHGGSGCPIQLNFVKISSDQSVQVPPIFGSCSDLIKVSATKDQIIVKMPDFMGAPENEEQERRVAKHKMTYIYNGQVVTENGKVIKNRERW